MAGQDHPDTLLAAGNLALTHCEQGKYAQAEQLMGEVVATMTRVRGEEHPDTLTAASHLAAAHRERGALAKAAELQVKVLAARKRLQGEQHPNTALAAGALGLTLLMQGQLLRVIPTRGRGGAMLADKGFLLVADPKTCDAKGCQLVMNFMHIHSIDKIR